MRAELLYISDCPSWSEVGVDLRAALDAAGLADTDVEFVLVASREQAAGVPFAGSPTILIDGVDLFPPANRSAELACRVYVTLKGLQSRPTRSQIEGALRNRE